MFDRGQFQREYAGFAEMYYQTNFGFNAFAGGCAERMRTALQRCAAAGQTRVVIYGAGTHTRACAEALMQPTVEIVGIIDDNPEMIGTRLWGYPVISLAQAESLKPNAVVLSSNSMEEALARKARAMENVGAAIVRLYQQPLDRTVNERGLMPTA